MNYYEVQFTYTSPIDTEIINDVLASELGEIGFESFTSNENGLTAYISEKLYDTEAIKDKITSFPLGPVTFAYIEKFIVSKNWNEAWEKNYFQPIRIGNECIIRASFHEAVPDITHTIIIDPKMAFGTGNHETTFLMISEILKLDLEGKEVLDMGCGTAVLAILAAKKGASRIEAVDIDEWAYNNALENIATNHTPNVSIHLGGAEKIAELGRFDFVFANINRNILLNDMASYSGCMKPGSILYMSGFYSEDIPVIAESCTNNGLKLVSFNEKNNWVAVRVEKQ